MKFIKATNEVIVRAGQIWGKDAEGQYRISRVDEKFAYYIDARNGREAIFGSLKDKCPTGWGVNWDYCEPEDDNIVLCPICKQDRCMTADCG